MPISLPAVLLIIPVNLQRTKHVIITLKRHFNVIIACLLHRVFAVILDSVVIPYAIQLYLSCAPSRFVICV